MTWSYSGDPSSSTLDEIRFLIQDTNTNEQLLSNEEITYLSTEYGDPYSAAIACVIALIGQAARSSEESKKVADLSLTRKLGDRLAQWEALKRHLEQERFRRFPAAPIVNPNALLPTVEREEEDEGSDFVVGQMDNRT